MPYFDDMDVEFKELRQLVARKRERFPELSLEDCVHLAVDEWYSPQFEPNEKFRSFLVARLRDGGDGLG